MVSERDDVGPTPDPVPDGPEGPAARGERATALEERLASVPAAPGVYLLKDAHGKVIYVGKAVNLRARVRSYLRGGDERSQVRFLVGKLADFETLVTANEKEALILENNLIKQYRPRYNIRLKDDKSYVSVKVTVREPWPRVLVTRRIVKDGSRYFGPFHSASAVRETLDTIRKIFPLRTCSDGVFRNRTRPCIEYDIKRCLAPCVLEVDRAAYDEHLRQAMQLLEGRSREVAITLRGRMQEAAAGERFEEAARLRDQLRAIEKTQERQQVVSHWGVDQDVFGLYREGGAIEVQVLFVRDGKLVSTQAHAFDDWELPDGEVLEAVLTQFYQATARAVPDEILLPVEISDAAVRMEYLAERRGRRVTIAVPQRGDKLRLVEMAQANARQSFVERRDAAAEGQRQVIELQRRLALPRPPRRIECVDIATFQGGETVGAVVAFDDGRPWKDGYRRFRIRSVEGTDDFAAVAEVLSRRFREGPRRAEPPDLLVIDGGLGQLGAATAALGALQLDTLAGDRAREGAGGARSRGARDPAPSRSGLPARSQEPRRPALQLDGALPPPAGARRGPPLREHLPPHAARPGTVALARSTRSTGVGPRPPPRAPAALRQRPAGAGGDAGSSSWKCPASRRSSPTGSSSSSRRPDRRSSRTSRPARRWSVPVGAWVGVWVVTAGVVGGQLSPWTPAPGGLVVAAGVALIAWGVGRHAVVGWLGLGLLRRRARGRAPRHRAGSRLCARATSPACRFRCVASWKGLSTTCDVVAVDAPFCSSGRQRSSRAMSAGRCMAACASRCGAACPSCGPGTTSGSRRRCGRRGTSPTRAASTWSGIWRGRASGSRRRSGTARPSRAGRVRRAGS